MIDLHLHSTHSDGTLSPVELVRMAAEREISAISITDHDTATATEEASAEGFISGVTVLSGLEISVFHGDIFFHLLGYDFNHKDAGLMAGLERLQIARNKRNKNIVHKLQEMGIAITENEVKLISGVGQTGRPHIARLLMDKKIVKTINQAFKNYLKKGACAYFSRFIYHVREAIDLIHGAGGVAVLAHPLQIDRSLGILPGLLGELVGMGLDGMEIYYPTQKGKLRKKLSALAEKHNLLETGGSDYHGDIRPGTSMAGGRNVTVPENLLEKLLKRSRYQR